MSDITAPYFDCNNSSDTADNALRKALAATGLQVQLTYKNSADLTKVQCDENLSVLDLFRKTFLYDSTTGHTLINFFVIQS